MPAALAMSCMDVRSPDVAISDAAVSSTSVRRVPSSPPDWFARTVTAADSRHDRGQTVGLAERKFGKRYQEAGPVLATWWVGGNECLRSLCRRDLGAAAPTVKGVDHAGAAALKG